MSASVSIVDQDNQSVDTVSTFYDSTTFNDAYANYGSDKQLLTYILKGTAYSTLDLSSLPDNFINS